MKFQSGVVLVTAAIKAVNQWTKGLSLSLSLLSSLYNSVFQIKQTNHLKKNYGFMFGHCNDQLGNLNKTSHTEWLKQ